MKNIYFDFNKATITAQSSARLDAAANIIKTDGGNYLLEGQTDKKGAEAYNLDLSRRRAAAVVAALDSRGVDVNAVSYTHLDVYKRQLLTYSFVNLPQNYEKKSAFCQ